MTTPGGDAFEYTDDSVIARVSFDVPSQALSDITQLSEAMAAMKVQLIAIARAQGDWLEYLQQVPAITEQANEALRAQITLLERQSYLKSEIGGGSAFSGLAGGYGGGGGAGYGGPGYSTAAPAGYGQGPFAGMRYGMGMGYGGYEGPITPEEGAAHAERIAGGDPGLAANVESVRGRAVNPALLGVLGAGVANVMGRVRGQTTGTGDDDGSDKSPSSTNKNRRSGKKVNADRGGTPDDGPDPSSPAKPGEDASFLENASYYLGRGEEFANEMAGDRKGRMKKIMGRIGETLGSARGVLDKIPTKPGDIPGMIGDVWGSMGGVGKSLTAAGAGILAFNAAQNVGERVTQFQQLGSVQGGDWMTGMKYEAQARIMALNPFITTQQARQAMQMALKEGFRGDNYDTVQDFMISNFKELGISMGQSMEIMKSQVKGLGEGDSQAGVSKDLEQTINTMKELSGQGGAALPTRINQLQEITETMSSLGFSPENATRTALGLQQGYGDKLALRDSIGNIGGQIMGSNMLMTLAAQKAGLAGHLPNALPAAFDQAGIDGDQIVELAAAEVASYVTGYPAKIDRIAAFQTMMVKYGVSELEDFKKAEALYDKVTGEEKPTATANRTIARQGRTNTSGGGMGDRGAGNAQSSNPADANWNRAHMGYTPSENAEGVADSYERAGRGTANFAPSGNPAPPIPSSPTPANLVSSVSTVTGNVTITVDQQGRITAPPTIQLTGQQKAALAGYGSTQLNNAPPGDPTYNHAYNAFPSGGGG